MSGPNMHNRTPSYVAVTGSTRPYVFDLPHLLSLPDGFEFRFRYRLKWVDIRVRRQLAKGAESFHLKTLILLFHSQTKGVLVPLREATIVSAELIGPIIFVRFRLGPLFDLGLNLEDPDVEAKVEQARQTLSDAALKAFAPDTMPDLKKPLPDGWFLRPSNCAVDDIGTRASTDPAWGALALSLRGEPELAHAPMFRLLGFQQEDRDDVPRKPIQNAFSLGKETIEGFELVEGHRYRLRLLEWYNPPGQAHPPTMRVQCEQGAARLELEGASDLIVGPYDVIEFTFRAQTPGYSEIAIRAEILEQGAGATGTPSGAGGAKPWPAVYVARVPFRVVRNAWRIAGLVAAFVVAVGMVVAAPHAGSLKDLLQVIGLFVAVGVTGAAGERYLKVREHVTKLNATPSQAPPH